MTNTQTLGSRDATSGSVEKGGDASIPRFGTLSPAECEQFLKQNTVGRLAYSLHDRANVLPVNYKYADGWLYGRTAPGGKLLNILRNRWVAFEVDQNDGLFDWRSVVVHGALYLIQPDGPARERAIYERAVDVLRELMPQTFSEGDPIAFRNQLFRIHAAEVSGRYSASSGGEHVIPPLAQIPDSADENADTTLRDEVLAVIEPFIHSEGATIQVEVFDGVVVLNGMVADVQARAAIEGSIVRLRGVHALVQQLETKRAAGVDPGPAEVALNAIRALRASPLPENSNVTAVVDHGWLRLEGTVASAKAREEIHRRLENIVGARGFVDRIVIAQRPRGAAARNSFAKDVG